MARRARAVRAAAVALTAAIAALAAVPGAAQQDAPAANTPAGAGVAQAGAQQTPAATVERLHAALVGAAQAHEGAALDERIEAIRPVIVATHDLPYIAELTIRREWASLSDAERARFVEAFSRLSITTYASRFGGLREGMFELGEPSEAAGGRQSVTATLVTDEREIPFEYVLHETESGWKIVNILADNVSDLAMKRAEYRRVLDAGSVDQLIDYLEQQQFALRGDRPIR